MFQCTALRVLTDSPGAQQRVLEHVKCPGQSALDAVLLEILLSLFQLTALFVLTDSPGAHQRVLGHVKCSVQSALDAVLLRPGAQNKLGLWGLVLDLGS